MSNRDKKTEKVAQTSQSQKEIEPSYEFDNSHKAAVRLEQLEKINSRNEQIVNTPALTNTDVTGSVHSSVNFITGSSANVTPQPDNIYGIPH